MAKGLKKTIFKVSNKMINNPNLKKQKAQTQLNSKKAQTFFLAVQFKCKYFSIRECLKFSSPALKVHPTSCSIVFFRNSSYCFLAKKKVSLHFLTRSEIYCEVRKNSIKEKSIMQLKRNFLIWKLFERKNWANKKLSNYRTSCAVLQHVNYLL